MTTVSFHFNVIDRFNYVCRLARKGMAANVRTVLVADADTLDQVDQHLWLAAATDFLPHCRDTAAPAVLTRSPLLLTQSVAAVPKTEVLITLCASIPDGFENFERVIEVVGQQEHERAAARQRWRQYAATGLQLTRFDAAGKAGTA